MEIVQQKKTDPLLSSQAKTREELVALGREVNARAGIPDKPTMTIEELHAYMTAQGIRPEDNAASHELLRMRYGNDYNQDQE